MEMDPEKKTEETNIYENVPSEDKPESSEKVDLNVTVNTEKTEEVTEPEPVSASKPVDIEESSKEQDSDIKIEESTDISIQDDDITVSESKDVSMTEDKEISEHKEISEDVSEPVLTTMGNPNIADSEESSECGSDEELEQVKKAYSSPNKAPLHAIASLQRILTGTRISKTSKKFKPDFKLIEYTKLLHQNEQMQTLNKSLSQYMINNKELDGKIKNLVEEIGKVDRERKAQDVDINQTIKDISSRYVSVLKKMDEDKGLTTVSKELNLRNSNLEEDCLASEMEIEALKAKISVISLAIKRTDDDIEANKEACNNLKPVVKGLSETYKIRSESNQKELVQMLLMRKKVGVDPVENHSKNISVKNMERLLVWYRQECAKKKAAIAKYNTDELQKQIKVAEIKFKELEAEEVKQQMQVKLMKREEHKLRAEIDIKKETIVHVELGIDHDRTSHAKDLENLDNKVDILEKSENELRKDLELALEDLRQVLLKDMGKKDRLTKELGVMTLLIKSKENQLSRNNSTKSSVRGGTPNKLSRNDTRSSQSSVGSTGSRRSNNSKKGGRRR